MKRTLLVCTFVAMLCVSFSAFAQDAAAPVRPDQPLHHQHESLINPKDVVTNIVASPYSGVLVYNFTVLTSTPIVDPVNCYVSVYVNGDASGRTYGETGYGKATPISAGYAKCTVKIYYTWQLSSAGSDMITGSYEFYGNTAASSGTTSRTASSNLVSITVPATGVTTTTSLSGRL